MSETKQIEAKDNITTLPQTVSAETMIMAAVEKGADVDTLERLLAMAEKIKAEQARSAYYSALSAFQSDCPVIKKTREVKNNNGSLRYRYANLEDIIGQVKPLLEKHGLSYSINSRVDSGFMISVCEIHHIAGHTEISEFAVPIDEGSFMNDAQKAASASTFSTRYSLKNALGIMTGDQDDDAQALGKGVSERELYKRFSWHMKHVLAHIAIVLDVKAHLQNAAMADTHEGRESELDSAAEAWAEINDANVVRALSLAPTKGGCFTVEERKQMDSDEFKALLIKYRKDNPMINLDGGEG